MNIIEQIKALFSKKTWSSSDANVSAQKILLGDANAEPSGIIGMNDLASVLGVMSVNNMPVIFDANDNLNGYTETSFYVLRQSSVGTGLLVVFKPKLSNSYYNVIQIVFLSGNGGIKYRSTQVWSFNLEGIEWKTISIP